MSGFPKIAVVAVGKVKKPWIRTGIDVYQKRLPELTLIEIKDSSPQKEGEQIIALLKESTCLLALAEEGTTCSSLEFSDFLAHADSGSLVFAIGGASGLSREVKAIASRRFSLSPMTFPHEIARLLLLEQLYRAKSILQGSSYHK